MLEALFPQALQAGGCVVALAARGPAHTTLPHIHSPYYGYVFIS
jgi:hypothetical protein